MGNNYNFTEESDLKVEERFKAKEDAKASVFSRINNQKCSSETHTIQKRTAKEVQANKSVR